MIDSYKKILKSQKTRLAILRGLSFIPDRWMIPLQYRIKTGRRLSLNAPVRLNEKLQWYKLYYRDPRMTVCVDKYAVRKYIADKGLSDILNPLYGVFENAAEIDFDRLPEKFVLKSNAGSGTNIFVTDKNRLDIPETRRTLNAWLHEARTASAGREWAYKDVPPRIVAEKYIETPTGDLADYKFFCYNGVPKYIMTANDRFTDKKIDYLDMNWNYIGKFTVTKSSDTVPEKPRLFDEMVRIASVLSSDFPFVRVDLYEVENRVVFGEMTFYPASGYYPFTPDSLDTTLGAPFILPEKRI